MKFIIAKDVLRKTQAAGLEIARLFEPAVEQGDFDDSIGEALEEAAQFKNFSIRVSPTNEDELIFEVSDYVLAQFLPLIVKIFKGYLTLSRALGDDLRAIYELLGERI